MAATLREKKLNKNDIIATLFQPKALCAFRGTFNCFNQTQMKILLLRCFFEANETWNGILNYVLFNFLNGVIVGT